ILERAHLVLGQRTLPADVDDRTFRAKRGRNPGNRICATGPGCCDDAAELARLAGVAIGRMRRYLLVAHIDDANAFVNTTVVDIDDVTAAKREYRINALVLQRLGDQVATRDDACLAALLLQSVLSCGRSRLHRQGVSGCHMSS